MPPQAPSGPQPPALTPLQQRLLYDGYQLQLRHQYEEAARRYLKLLQQVPDHADVLHLLGIVRARQEKHQEAIALYKKALSYRPGDAKAWYNLALAHGAMGNKGDSVESMERAFTLDPALPLAPNVLFPARRAAFDWRGHDGFIAILKRAGNAGEATAIPFISHYIADDPALQLATARRKVEEEMGGSYVPLHDPEARRADEGRIKVAYLSADFRLHPTTQLVAPVLEAHDRERFEITALSIGPDDGSPERRRVVDAVDYFLDLKTVPPAAIAKEVAMRGIHILVDLMGHTEGNRLEVFQHRPAPIQTAYLGYPGTTGLDAMDYIIADPMVAPFAHQEDFREEIVQLPCCYQPNGQDLPVVARPTRMAAALPESAVVFAAFNSAHKLDPETFSSWTRILKAVPGSVLWILAKADASRENLRREAQARGVDPTRLIFTPPLPLAEHLARIPLADLFLDTFPYTAHTTGSDALRMGLPIVTRKGRSFASRVAASLLHQVGLDELVTDSAQEYEALAIALGNDATRRAAVRARLEEALPGSPLFDAERHTRHLERAYEMMMERFRADLPPLAFAVED